MSVEIKLDSEMAEIRIMLTKHDSKYRNWGIHFLPART